MNISNFCSDSQERLSFLTAAANKVNNPNSQDAYVYATVAVATVKLELKDFEGARKDLDKAEKILDNFDSVETVVHAAFYRVNADYYQVCISTKIQISLLILLVQTRVCLVLPECASLPRLYRTGCFNSNRAKKASLRLGNCGAGL